MALKTEKVFRSFVKGLVTEASPLTFPENASIDEENFVLNRDGSRSRRLGLDYEPLYQVNSTGLTAADIQTGKQSFHRWDSPGGETTVGIGIVRIKNKLWFLNLLASAPSANLLNSGSPITISGLNDANIETDVINNKCIIVSKDLSKPVVLSYNPDTDVVSQSTIDIKVRDIWGLDDGLTADNRPSSLSNDHKYNLRNQGWNPNIVTNSGTYPDALDYTKNALGVYPSNSDSWQLGKDSNPASSDYEKYIAANLKKNSTSKFQVARGSHVIDAFNRGSSRESVSGVSSLNADQETGKLSTVASYAQRLFYSGVNSSVTDSDARSPNYSGYVFFTQVVTSDEQLGSCYQKTDPTDPALNDLVDSDGGTIQIPDCTRIVKIAASQSSLLVFAENGVWEIFGDTGGFFATSFQLSKISTNGVSNPKSVVSVNGNFVYWSKAGIYLLSPDAAGGRFKAQSISLTTIQQLFLDIPELGKNNCKGFYDEKENRVRWLYNDTTDGTYASTNYVNRYNKELILDLTLEAFYVNKLTATFPYVADYVDIPGYVSSTTSIFVLKGTDTVKVTSGDDVIIDTDVELNRSSQFSFLTIVNTSFTISKYSSTTFKDWYTFDSVGKNYTSYLVTGYELFNDTMRRKQVNYVFFYFTRTEDGYSLVGSNLELDNQSSCKVQAQWEWANSANSGRWGTEFQAYRLLRHYIPTGAGDPFDYGDSVIVTKNKLRGSGKCLSLKITSEAGKDMKLLGWAVPAVATSNV